MLEVKELSKNLIKLSFSSSDMVVWEREPWLRFTHIKATMKYHKGYVVIMGGTGLSNDGNILAYNDHPYVEFLSQNGQYNTVRKVIEY